MNVKHKILKNVVKKKRCAEFFNQDYRLEVATNHLWPTLTGPSLAKKPGHPIRPFLKDYNTDTVAMQVWNSYPYNLHMYILIYPNA